MSFALRQLGLFLCAVQFLTRLPTPALTGFEPDWISRSARYFPLVGLLVGGICAAVFWGASQLWTGALPALLAIGVGVLVTGAFHEDGLADTADGLGGGLTRERALEIMKDSRIGSYGTVALLLALVLKVALLALIAQRGAWPAAAALLAAHALSRLAPLVVMRSLPYVSDAAHAKAKPIAEAVTGRGFGIGCLWSIPALALIWQAQGALGLIASLLLWAAALAFMLRLLRRRLQGFTGDTLGATQQVCELALYLGFALAWP